MPYISSGAPECLSCTRPQDFSPVHLTRTIGIDSTSTSLLAGNTPVSACSPRSSKVVSFSFPQIRQRWISVYIKGSLAGSQESVNHEGRTHVRRLSAHNDSCFLRAGSPLGHAC